ncbi:sensor histidine kinase [Clostridioides difficile]|uniref:histidine kinase n=3 Tax=Bacillota TaxID=1239 RepID=Q18DA3_CLOD6|nr:MULTISPECIES: HAMP domain-containing sensor histidine kinase [Bacillota]AJP10061.1 two-component sensor histidine kinase [Clostridioides difficile 630]EQE12377.1 his Kinase A domain protein [Clostridioides difficile CD13]EQI62920.1 his Kinase A domain protein [Clostridioides difficile Y266]MDU6396594.1 HAMP domain-containing sensor histidine kinase [Bacteroides sp.]ARE61269.1 two-component sensor histidine kinase [Clostridioides difficile]
MVYLVIILFLCILALLNHIYHTRKKIKEIVQILDDIYLGNLDRRLVVNENTEMSNLVYKINEIVIKDKNKLLEFNKSEKAYKKLVTSLSHDIRTPLSSLVGYLEVLEKDNLSYAEQQKFLQIAKEKALHLSDYIQSLFEWLKLESGEWVYDFQTENICELTRLVLADWIMKFEENKIDFHFDIPEKALYVIIDKNAFNRIINNLLSNTIKHSHANKLIVQIIEVQDKIQISITDNGVGIEEKDLPFIFDRLYKCDTSRTENSNGLGLAIAKELITALNGTIAVNSCYGKGTTFNLKFIRKHE